MDAKIARRCELQATVEVYSAAVAEIEQRIENARGEGFPNENWYTEREKTLVHFRACLRAAECELEDMEGKK